MVGAKSKAFLVVVMVAFVVTACGIVRGGDNAPVTIQMTARAAVEYGLIVMVAAFFYYGHGW